jgi:hypothetical protein
MNYKPEHHAGDKLFRFVVLFMVSGIYLSTLTGLLSVGAAWGKQLDWSFSEHPRPESSQHTEAERAEWMDVLSTYIMHGNFCDHMLKIDFEIYNRRYPHFVETGDPVERFRAWTNHVVAVSSKFAMHPERIPAACIIQMPYDELIRVLAENSTLDLTYCGVYSRLPKTRAEQKFVKAVDDWMDYALLGSPDPMQGLLQDRLPKQQINLNADVEYYLLKYLQIHGETMFDWGTQHLDHVLTAERKAFVDAAVERRDFAAVLDTTPPCGDAATADDTDAAAAAAE